MNTSVGETCRKVPCNNNKSKVLCKKQSYENIKTEVTKGKQSERMKHLTPTPRVQDNDKLTQSHQQRISRVTHFQPMQYARRKPDPETDALHTTAIGKRVKESKQVHIFQSPK